MIKLDILTVKLSELMGAIVHKNNQEFLLYLLQNIYFDNIDNANADAAVEAMHDSIAVSYTHLTLQTKA